jgi:hypothetical protein
METPSSSILDERTFSAWIEFGFWVMLLPRASAFTGPFWKPFMNLNGNYEFISCATQIAVHFGRSRERCSSNCWKNAQSWFHIKTLECVFCHLIELVLDSINLHACNLFISRSKATEKSPLSFIEEIFHFSKHFLPADRPGENRFLSS